MFGKSKLKVNILYKALNKAGFLDNRIELDIREERDWGHDSYCITVQYDTHTIDISVYEDDSLYWEKYDTWLQLGYSSKEDLSLIVASAKEIATIITEAGLTTYLPELGFEIVDKEGLL
jgi:hypothetical protein